MTENTDDAADYLARQQELWAERKAKLKTGPNVINLSYLSQHIGPQDLSALESDAMQLGFEFSALDKSGMASASISSLTADLLLVLSEQVTVTMLLVGSLNSGFYDGIKALIIKCWKLIKDKRTVTMTTRTVTERHAKFHLLIKVNEHQSVELRTENLDAQNISTAIDQITSALQSLDKKEANNLLIYDPGQSVWTPEEININYLKRPEEFIRQVPLDEYLEELKRKAP